MALCTLASGSPGCRRGDLWGPWHPKSSNVGSGASSCWGALRPWPSAPGGYDPGEPGRQASGRGPSREGAECSWASSRRA